MRKEFSKDVKRQAWARCMHKGRHYCEHCDAELDYSVVRPQYDHIIPDWMGGESTLDNCQVLCAPCHLLKTSRRDVPAIAKSKRIRDKLSGVHTRKGRPMPGTKASRLRKRMDGTVERR